MSGRRNAIPDMDELFDLPPAVVLPVVAQGRGRPSLQRPAREQNSIAPGHIEARGCAYTQGILVG